MEVNEDEHDPESNFKNLVHQVEDQSEFCDVTVRSGDWTKKFHRCVLAASLLFQIMIEAQIMEIDKGNGIAMADILPHALLEVKTEVPPDIVEMAIMFMYGLIPEFSMRNIGGLLELAEYLKIRDLNDACIDWLNDIDYSEVDYMHVFRLSRKYNFEITPCIDYMQSHIPEMFDNEDAVNLPTDFVEYLFTDEKFSYVETDEKLKFLVKLAKKHLTKSTKDIVVRLFNTIDVKEVSEPTWEHAQRDTSFSIRVNLANKVRSKYQGNAIKSVMMIPSDDDYFACIDLQDDIWYRLNSHFFDIYSYDHHEHLGIRNNNPEVYFKEKYLVWDHLSLKTVDLKSDQVRRHHKHVESFGGHIRDEDITHVNFRNDTLIAIIKKNRLYESSDVSDNELESELESEPESDIEDEPLESEIESEPVSEFENEPEIEDESEHENDIESEHEIELESENESEHASELENVHEDDHELELECSNHDVDEENVNDEGVYIQIQGSVEVIQKASTDDASCMIQAPGICIDEPFQPLPKLSPSECPIVYIGNASEEDGDMYPLFSFRNDSITQICINDQSILALLTISGGLMNVILYDLLQFKMERILSVQEGKYDLCATDNGFLLHKESDCYCFTKQSGSFSSGNYKMEKFMLENKEDWFVKYHYQGGIWMRILRRSMHNDVELQYISHEDLTLCYGYLDVNWKNVSMPKDKHLFQKVMNFENIFIVPLSKSKLRCNISCPHCKYLEDSDYF